MTLPIKPAPDGYIEFVISNIITITRANYDKNEYIIMLSDKSIIFITLHQAVNRINILHMGKSIHASIEYDKNLDLVNLIRLLTI